MVDIPYNQFDWAKRDAEKAKERQEKAEALDKGEVEVELTEWQVEQLRAAGVNNPEQMDQLVTQALALSQGVKALRYLWWKFA